MTNKKLHAQPWKVLGGVKPDIWRGDTLICSVNGGFTTDNENVSNATHIVSCVNNMAKAMEIIKKFTAIRIYDEELSAMKKEAQSFLQSMNQTGDQK